VHAKDTLILHEDLYEYGNLQPATLAKPHGHGGHHWRYTIPGHGCADWPKLLGILKKAGYAGVVSVELEDEDFHGSAEQEQRGLIASREFLEAV
jgi:sugar phosphate isomerase/epimerase